MEDGRYIIEKEKKIESMHAWSSVNNNWSVIDEFSFFFFSLFVLLSYVSDKKDQTFIF